MLEDMAWGELAGHFFRSTCSTAHKQVSYEQTCRHDQVDLLTLKSSIRIGRTGNIISFEHGMIVGCLYEYFINCSLLGFSPTHPSLRFAQKGSEKDKIRPEQQFYGQKFLVDVRGQWPHFFQLIGGQ